MVHLFINTSLETINVWITVRAGEQNSDKTETDRQVLQIHIFKQNWKILKVKIFLKTVNFKEKTLNLCYKDPVHRTVIQ